MGRMKIVIFQDGEEQRIEMDIEAALKIAFEQRKLYEDDKDKERDLIKEISACLDGYKKANASLVLLEWEENEKTLVKIII